MRIFILFITFTFLACGTNTINQKPAYSGKPGELFIVIPNDAVQGPLRDSINSFCQSPYPALPQYEYNLDPIFHSQSTFSPVDHLHRNILIVSIADKSDHQNANVNMVNDRWANNQLVFILKAKNEAIAANTVSAYGPELIKLINNMERLRIQLKLALSTNKIIEKKLADEWGLEMIVPSDFTVAIDNKNCLWLSREKTRSLTVKNYGREQHEITQGLVIYKFPYRSDSTFTTSYLQMTRDSILGKYVKSSNKDGIKTETRYYPVVGFETSLNEKYAYETRFLWRFDDPIMGGPAINLATIDSSGEWVICIEGFVFAPKFDKREYLREMEAMIYSAKLSGGAARKE